MTLEKGGKEWEIRNEITSEAARILSEMEKGFPKELGAGKNHGDEVLKSMALDLAKSGSLGKSISAYREQNVVTELRDPEKVTGVKELQNSNGNKQQA